MKSLQVRLLLIVLAALAPILALEAYHASEASDARRQIVQDDVLRLAQMVTSDQARIIEAADQLLNTIGGSPPVADNIPGICERMLASALEMAPRYVSSAIIGLDGHFVCTPEPSDRNIDFSDREFFRLALQTGDFAVGEHVIGRVTGKRSLHMARPFKNRAGVVAGVVVLALDLDWMQAQLARLPLPPRASVAITDRHGSILARYPADPRMIGRTLPAGQRIVPSDNHAGVVAQAGLDGMPRAITYAAAESRIKGLTIRADLDRESTFASMTARDSQDLALIFFSAILAILTTAILGRRFIRRPVDRLLGVAVRWRAGDLSVRAGLAEDDSEFGRLGAAYDLMATVLEARTTALETALESTTDSVFVLDRAYRLTFLNKRAWSRMVGGQTLLGRTIWESLPDLKETFFATALVKAMDSGEAAKVEDDYAPLSVRLVAHIYPSKEGLTIFARDVTEERRAAEALRHADRLFRAAFEQAAVGMAIVSLNRSWLRVNDKVCAITGYARESLIARPCREISHPDDLDVDRAKLEDLLAGKIATFATEKRYIRSDGTPAWVNLTVSLLRDTEGKPELFIGVIEDISSRKEVEIALRESETRLQLARDAAGIGVWDWDISTGSLVWSDEEWRQFGRPSQAGPADRQIWLASLHPQDVTQVLAEEAAALADPHRPFDTKYRVVWPDGTVRSLLAKAKTIRNARGEAIRMVGVNIDITDSLAAASALRQAQRLEAVGQLTVGIAHDFNNMLSVVVLEAEILAEGEDPEVVRAATAIVSTAHRGADLVRRLLAFGRRQPLARQSIDVNVLLEELAALLRRTLPESIQVELGLWPQLWAAEVDPSQLQDALLNLALNARDAMAEGGHLWISTEPHVIEPDQAREIGISPGEYVAISVKDSGAGMDADVLDHALEPYFTTKPTGRGTGLGLSMVYGFVRQSGGDLTIESAVNIGTTIRILVPRSKIGVVPSKMQMPLKERCGSGRILLVDDNDMLRQAVKLTLTSLNYDVVEAQDGPTALERMRASPPFDLLFTDMVMPLMSGSALAEAAVALQPGLKVLFTTGYDREGAETDCLLGRRMLMKPYSRAEFAAKVREAMAS